MREWYSRTTTKSYARFSGRIKDHPPRLDYDLDGRNLGFFTNCSVRTPRAGLLRPARGVRTTRFVRNSGRNSAPAICP